MGFGLSLVYWVLVMAKTSASKQFMLTREVSHEFLKVL